MADKTLVAIGKTCSRVSVRLRELQAQLYQCGLTAEAADLEKIITELQEAAYFCDEEDTGVYHRLPRKR